VHDAENRKSLRISVFEGISHAVMIGAGETFIVPFAVFLLATDLQIGLLSCLPMFLGSLPQLWSWRLVLRLRSRKKLVVIAAALQAFFWVPMAATAVGGAAAVWALIVLASLYWCGGMILQPAWAGWMAELVPAGERGTYFGHRNRFVQVAAFLGLAGGGVLLRGREQAPLHAFLTLFAIAAAARFLSAFLLSRQNDPPLPAALPRPALGFFRFLTRMPERNFGWLSLYLVIVNFSVHIASPFYIPYLLRDLGISYSVTTFLIGLPVLVKFLFFPFWGRLSDRYGSKKVLIAAGFIMPVTPILWSISGDLIYLAIVQIFSGIIWAAYDLVSYNFLLEATSPRNRVSFMAYYGVLNSFAALAGGLTGWGLLVAGAAVPLHYPFLFLLSGLLRWIPALALLKRLRETRIVEPLWYRNLVLRLFTVRPTRGLTVRPVVMAQNLNGEIKGHAHTPFVNKKAHV
jgi:MFS family permease